MKQATKLNREKVAISHGLELYSYLLTRSSRKSKSLYHFEKYYISKAKNVEKYKSDEKELKALDNKIHSTLKKKVVQLT